MVWNRNRLFHLVRLSDLGLQGSLTWLVAEEFLVLIRRVRATVNLTKT